MSLLRLLLITYCFAVNAFRSRKNLEEKMFTCIANNSTGPKCTLEYICKSGYRYIPKCVRQYNCKVLGDKKFCPKTWNELLKLWFGISDKNTTEL